MGGPCPQRRKLPRKPDAASLEIGECRERKEVPKGLKGRWTRCCGCPPHPPQLPHPPQNCALAGKPATRLKKRATPAILTTLPMVALYSPACGPP